MVFKTKDMTSKAKRNKGASCDQAGKSDILKTLNLIVGEINLPKKILKLIQL